MSDELSRYASRTTKKPLLVSPRKQFVRTRLPRNFGERPGFARIGSEEIAALGRVYGASLALHLEMIRLAGLGWVKRHDGWILLDRETRTAFGLIKRQTCSDAVRRLLDFGFIEVRGTAGNRLEYRLNPDWAKPKAKVDTSTDTPTDTPVNKVVSLKTVRAKRAERIGGNR